MTIVHLQPTGMRKHEDRLYITFYSDISLVLQHGRFRWEFTGESVSENFMSFLEGWRQSWTETAVQIWPPDEQRGFVIDRGPKPKRNSIIPDVDLYEHRHFRYDERPKSLIIQARISGGESGLTYLYFSDKEVARAVKEIRDLDRQHEENKAHHEKMEREMAEEDAQLERDRLDAIKWREHNQGKSE